MFTDIRHKQQPEWLTAVSPKVLSQSGNESKEKFKLHKRKTAILPTQSTGSTSYWKWNNFWNSGTVLSLLTSLSTILKINHLISVNAKKVKTDLNLVSVPKLLIVRSFRVLVAAIIKKSSFGLLSLMAETMARFCFNRNCYYSCTQCTVVESLLMSTLSRSQR